MSLLRTRTTLGALATLTSAVVSWLLAMDSIRLVGLPGCGESGACELAAASVWGEIPFVKWPISFLGAAYFTALLVSLLLCRLEMPREWRGLRWIGGASSLFYLTIMGVKGFLCPYCVLVHASHGIAIFTLPASRNRTSRLGLSLFAVVFVLCSLSLGLWRSSESTRIATEQELALKQSIELATHSEMPGPLIGRYLKGSASARARLVIFTDFQCEDCSKLTGEIEMTLSRGDVSLSLKHFPMDSRCNRHVPRTLHDNACWAARAAEAAGIINGDQGFWLMTQWLYEHSGHFRATELEAQVRLFGWDPILFKKTMEGPLSLRNVQGDIEEAISLGISITPMVFLNGVEMMGILQKGAMIRAVDAVLAGPETHEPEADRPVGIRKQILDAWEVAGVVDLEGIGIPLREPSSEKASSILVIGDHQEGVSRELDRRIRDWVKNRSDVEYRFLPFPLDKSCNPQAPKSLHDKACGCALSLIAAFEFGGSNGSWMAQSHLMDKTQGLGSAPVLGLREALSVDVEHWNSAMKGAQVTLDGETRRALPLLIDRKLPSLYIDGRPVARWKVGLSSHLEALLEHAALMGSLR